MGVYTIDDVNKKSNETGIKLSDADMRLAQSNPDAGMSIIQYKNDYAKATTQAQKDAAHAGAENVRQSFGFSGGNNGAAYYNQNLKPTYTNQYDAQMNTLFDKLMNREKFSYDASTDPLYQQYKDLYVGQGQKAMQDTMGQAAALTGGYGSSYAQNVGQQAYDSYLQKLNEVVPELYGQAYEMYQQEGNDLANQYNMLANKEAQDYGRYQDALSNYYTQENLNYERAKDSYDKLVNLMTSTGYQPTDAELANANMSAAERDAYLKAYQQALASAGGGSGRSGGSGKGSGGTGKTKQKNYFQTGSSGVDKAQYDGLVRTAKTYLAQGNIAKANQVLLDNVDDLSDEQYKNLKAALNLK